MREKRKRAVGYIAGTAALAVLVLIAFFLPRLVFGLQDSYRCREDSFAVQEEQDITLLTTSYEPSLYQRLLRYAEDCREGKEIYVVSKELEPNQELYDFLDSSIGLKQDAVALWLDMNLIPYAMFYDSEVSVWSQHVIYSDSYAGGVNFILWSIEMKTKSGSVCRLLLDAETGSVYGIAMNWRAESEKHSAQEGAVELLGEELDTEAWYALAYLYGAFSADDLGSYEVENYLVQGTESAQTIEHILNNGEPAAIWEIAEEGGGIYRALFPYSDSCLEFRLDMTEKSGIRAGFPTIYEQIPGFIDFETE